MSEHQTAAATATPDPNAVLIDRSMFDRIQQQALAVTETETKLKSVAAAHKEAKQTHESALLTMQGLVNAMIRHANGEPSDTPLFDNMNDAIDSATSDPIVTGLVNRMIDHGLTHVNALIVAGYSEDQRDELRKYLDALDERRFALKVSTEMPNTVGGVEATVEIPPVPDMPAFLQPQDAQPQGTEPEREIGDEEVSGALREIQVEMKRKHISLMTQAQRREVLDYSAAVQAVHLKLGEAVTYDDLPSAPSFVMAPAELERAAKASEEATEDAEPVADETPAPKKARAPRRSSKEFTNSPRMAGKVKKAKGKRSEAVS